MCIYSFQYIYRYIPANEKAVHIRYSPGWIRNVWWTQSLIEGKGTSQGLVVIANTGDGSEILHKLVGSWHYLVGTQVVYPCLSHTSQVLIAGFPNQRQ